MLITHMLNNLHWIHANHPPQRGNNIGQVVPLLNARATVNFGAFIHTRKIAARIIVIVFFESAMIDLDEYIMLGLEYLYVAKNISHRHILVYSLPRSKL